MKSSTKTIFDQGVKLQTNCSNPEVDPVLADLQNADGKITEVNPYINAQKAQMISDLQNFREDDSTKLSLETNTPLDDDVVDELVVQKPSYVYELFSVQDFVSDNTFNKLWTDTMYSDSDLKTIFSTQQPRSEAALSIVSLDATGNRGGLLIEQVLIQPDHLSAQVILNVIKNNRLSSSTIEGILLDQPYLSDDLLDSLWLAPISDSLLIRVLSHSKLNRNALFSVIENSTYHVEVGLLAELCIAQKHYPSDTYIQYYLNELVCSDAQGLFELLKIAPYNFSALTLSEINDNTVLSNEQKSLITKYQDPLNSLDLSFTEDCGCAELSVTAEINEITEYEYYEADHTGKILNNSYLNLMDLDLDDTTTVFYLKHEPSWQLSSTRKHFEELPGFLEQQEYFYLFDLQNALDRYRDQVYHDDPRYDFDSFDNSWYFDYQGSNFSEAVPYINPVVKSRYYNMRSLAFQQRNSSKNTYDDNPIVRSSYFEYKSTWNTVGDSPSAIPGVFPSNYCYTPPPTPVSNNCGNVVTALPPPGSGPDWIDWVYNFGDELDIIEGIVNGTNSSTSGGSGPPITDDYSDVIPPGTKITQKSLYKDKSFITKKKPNGQYKDLIYSLTQANHRLQLENIYQQVDTIVDPSYFDEGIFIHNIPIASYRKNESTDEIKQPTGVFEEIGGEWTEVYDNYDDNYELVIPFQNLRTFNVHERDYFGEPRVIENERGLITKITYGQELVKYFYTDGNCSDCSGICEHFDALYASDIGTPTKIQKGVYYNDLEEEYQENANCLTSNFTYHPNSILASLTDPNGSIVSQEHDHYGRMTQSKTNGDLISEVEYHQWDSQNTGLSFWEKAHDNYIESKAHYTPVYSLVSRGYIDPLGGTFASISKIDFDDSFGNYSEFISSNISFKDEWGRGTKSFKPRAYSLGSPADFIPMFDDNMASTEASHEMNLRGRSLSSSLLCRNSFRPYHGL